jgi:Polysaccharide lyase
MAWKLKFKIIMKNRTWNGIAILCFILSTALLSCQKESATPNGATGADNASPLTYDKNDYLNDAADNAVPDESEMETVDNSNALTASVTTAGTRRNLIFHSNNESTSTLSPLRNTSFTQWASIQKFSSYSVQRVNTLSRFGTSSLRFELRKTDGDIGWSKRAEASRYTKSEPSQKCERWYGESIYLPSDYVTDPAPELVTQWHTDAGSPPLALWTHNGKWRITMFGNQQTTIATYEKNKWVDWVYHVKWSAGSDGLVEVWKDGVKVFTKTGANIYSNSIGGAYMRVGVYKWVWKSGSNPASTTTKRIMYVDEVRIGGELATYNDVAPGNY